MTQLERRGHKRRYATHAACLFGRGRQKEFASVLRYCTIAARWNSSRAADFGKLVADDTEKWGKVIRAANIKPE